MKNLLKFLLLVLSNQKGELDLVAEANTIMESEASEGNDDGTPDNGTGDIDGTSNENDEVQNLEGQSETDPNNQDEDIENLSSEELLKKMAELEGSGPTEATEDFLKTVNDLGAIHNGELVEVKDGNHLKELIQKGFDYTQKTMEHSNTVKEFEQERETFANEMKEFQEQEAEFSNELLMGELFASALQKIKADDPDTFDMIQNAVQAEEANYRANSSIFDKYEKRINEMEDKYKSALGENESAKFKEVREQWNDQKKTAQEGLTKDLSKLGIKVDWDGKVFEAWKNDSSNTKTVEQVVHEVYSEAIKKGYQSQINLLKAKNKSKQSRDARGAGGSGAGATKEVKNYTSGNYNDILSDALKEIS